ncbi:iron uptake system protein EfeO [Georgenia sp. SYP-B2076]|uniref:iron uptake system protein EfeO n=1 Tax=Georgenia sp. SYP-B2076 TaxID=2495881 RepID=UPI000F8F34DE|nr:iron uptake system protein EfeO [Georgenia sp. SYP-B2076]
MSRSRGHRTTQLAAAAGALALTVTLTACTDNTAATPASGGGATTVTVDSSADACTLSAPQAPSGHLVFTVTNTGPDVTEFYLLAEDGLRIVAEVENIGPGISRDLVVTAKPGSYVTACKPGMAGDGIRAPFTVTDSGTDVAPTGQPAAQAETATANYVTYVKDQTQQLLTGTQAFVDAYKAGDDDAARGLYAPTRMHWERIEPVAESFGDLDPLMDLREADLEQGQEWTGWHLLEKDLWPPAGGAATPLTPEQRAHYADLLLEHTTQLDTRVGAADFEESMDAATIANGAKSLLDEVATGKVTGEEEIWSHTDLWDFQGNVDGARVAYEGLRDIVRAEDPDLAAELDEQFTAVQALLDAQRVGDGFKTYTDLTEGEVRAFADAVNALGEPLSRLAAAVVL